MDYLKLIIQFFAAFWGCLVALMSIMFFVRLRWPAPALWILKLYTSALSPLLAVIGLFTAIVGLATASHFISTIGIYDISIFIIHLYLITRPPDSSSNFEKAFGLHWQDRIKPEQKKNFLQSRTILSLPNVPQARLEPNIPFATIPGTDRQLLCDIWRPNKDIVPSGLAFIYLHGGAWYLLDKDFLIHPFFSHLTAQGHVIIDVAYRLAPETDMMGMVNDVKRAINWMKENASAFGVNPDKISVGGGSAGGHLALLAAYTASDPQFTPMELQEKNLSVCGVVSLYGPSDLKEMYYHTNQHLTIRLNHGRHEKNRTQLPKWVTQKMGKDYHRLALDKGFQNASAFASFIGGHPDEAPHAYALFSPVIHVHPNCPPTLLIHGEHDVMAPVNATCHLYDRLIKENIPAVMHILPQTDHAFDLQLPKYSPSAHNAIFDIERFLALLV